MTRILGVGFLGAGPATQAIHLPTLARLQNKFRIANVMDPVGATAEAVAARVGAAWTTDAAALLADPAVDVVAISSPSQFHAEQALAAIAAGKRGILIEKPLAVTREEADAIADAAREAGTAIIVGAMHVFDPGWRAALEHHAEKMCGASFIRQTVALPPNPVFEDRATEIASRVGPPPPRDYSQPEVRAAAIRGGILGLAIHDLPLVRQLVADWAEIEVLSARALAPFGYVLNMRAGAQLIQMVASFHRHCAAAWSLECHGQDGVTTVNFTPSYVHAGSADVAWTGPEGSTTIRSKRSNGYEAEWEHIHAMLVDNAPPIQTIADALDDFSFAMQVADGAAREAAKDWF